MNTVNPFFSVVIPTYNRAYLLLPTVQSVLNQAFRDFEVIVVDNHSTDNTKEILAPYVESGQLIYIQNDKNYERCYSRNRGFREAKGRFVALLDSDDILYPSCLQDAYDYVQMNPEVRFFHCLYELVDNNYNPIRKLRFPPVKNPFKQIMKGNFISNIGVFYRKDVVEKVQFDETPIMVGAEDYDFVLRALAETKQVGRISKVNCGLQMHPQRSVNLEQYKQTLIRIHYFIDKSLGSKQFMETYGRYARLFVCHLYLYMTSFAAVKGKTRKAFSLWLTAVRQHFPVVFTRKCWVYFLVIIKYAFR